MSATEYGPPGLAITSIAPAASASIVAADPVCVVELTITTGSGRLRISSRRNVRPSIRGISRSSVMMSGLCAVIRSRATMGSAATPTTSMSGSALIALDNIVRTMAESSTMSTRLRRTGATGLGLELVQHAEGLVDVPVNGQWPHVDLDPQAARHVVRGTRRLHDDRLAQLERLAMTD